MHASTTQALGSFRSTSKVPTTGHIGTPGTTIFRNRLFTEGNLSTPLLGSSNIARTALTWGAGRYQVHRYLNRIIRRLGLQVRRTEPRRSACTNMKQIPVRQLARKVKDLRVLRFMLINEGAHMFAPSIKPSSWFALTKRYTSKLHL